MNDPLHGLVETTLSAPPPAAARLVADQIIARHGSSVRAILFYGSNRRSQQPEGVLDFYVLVDNYRAHHRSFIRALMNGLLPPNVEFMRVRPIAAQNPEPSSIAAKVAVISLDQFARRMRPRAIDTTLWARFVQPSSLIYAADAAAREQVIRALSQAAHTACFWANGAAQETGSSAFWMHLFARTYAAELRVERGRPQMIYAHDPDYYDALFDLLAMDRNAAARGSQMAWARRRLAGKCLSILRLCKAAFTFEGGVDYLLWKVQRHSGVVVALRPWQRRHPILAAPWVLYRLYRRGIIG